MPSPRPNPSEDRDDLEALADSLDASGLYRVLRRIEPQPFAGVPAGVATRKAIFLDLETTGLDASSDEVIEIALLPFTYALDGTVWGMHPPYQSFRQPAKPIPAEITRITGIDDAMVAGAAPDFDAITQLLGEASLIVAHNAAFDRAFAEKLLPAFQDLPWACSMAEVDWAGEGFQGTKLAYLAMENGLFYDGHRALADCTAGVALLSRALPKSGTTAMAALLAKARRTTCRIWAEQAPFDLKHLLKARSYRWNDGSNGMPRAWYLDIDEADCAAELAWLRADIYQREVELQVRRMTARERYSDRIEKKLRRSVEDRQRKSVFPRQAHLEGASNGDRSCACSFPPTWKALRASSRARIWRLAGSNTISPATG